HLPFVQQDLGVAHSVGRGRSLRAPRPPPPGRLVAVFGSLAAKRRVTIGSQPLRRPTARPVPARRNGNLLRQRNTASSCLGERPLQGSPSRPGRLAAT